MNKYVTVLLITATAIIIMYFVMTAAKKNIHASWTKDYIFAHRGLHNDFLPENSIGAITAAIERNYAVEIDVHLSKDKVLMVFHDHNLKRMTGKDRIIEKCTYSQLRELKLGSSEETIPTLREVLDLVDDKVPVIIETKTEGRAGELEENLYEMLKSYKGRVAVQSFSPYSIGWFYRNAPEIIRGQLSYCFSVGAEHINVVIRFLLKHLMSNIICRPNFISYEKNSIGNAVIKRMKMFKIPIIAWTITSHDEYENVKPIATSIIFEKFVPGKMNNEKI